MVTKAAGFIRTHWVKTAGLLILGFIGTCAKTYEERLQVRLNTLELNVRQLDRVETKVDGLKEQIQELQRRIDNARRDPN